MKKKKKRRNQLKSKKKGKIQKIKSRKMNRSLSLLNNSKRNQLILKFKKLVPIMEIRLTNIIGLKH